jgi:hypothetical protein
MEMATDLEDKTRDLDPSNTVVSIQLLDNSCFKCKTPEGDRILPRRKSDGKYHVEGELAVIGKDTLREHFLALQPVFKAVRAFKVIVLTPLPRYLWNRCCGDPTHITNSERVGFASDMGNSLRELTVNLRNMVFMRKLKGVSVFNTIEALGIVPGNSGECLELDRILALWGADPVHPTQAAYRLLAEKIAYKVGSLLVDNGGDTAASATGSSKRKADVRDQWVSGSQCVAKRSEGTVGPPRGGPSRGRALYRGRSAGHPGARRGGWPHRGRGRFHGKH